MYDFHIPRWNELPNIDLYLDQVVTLINSSLSSFILADDNNDKDDSQILTKTMINNYVKNSLIESPIKKKYSKMQLAKLFIICILKQVYSMNEIENLIYLALKNSNIKVAYDSFCNKFEEALNSICLKKNFIDSASDSVNTNNINNEKKTENSFLLKSVILSCSYKIYVQNTAFKQKEIEKKK